MLILDHQLILAFPEKDISKVMCAFRPDDPVQWVYLGKDSYLRRVIEKQLGARFKRIDIARLHNDIARDLLRPFVDWTDDLNRMNGKGIEWWFGSISSRNTYQSNIFQYCCYLETLKRLWGDDLKRPALVIVESPGLARIIQKWAEQSGIRLRRLNSPNLQHYFAKFLPFLRWAKFALIILLRCLAAFLSRVLQTKKCTVSGEHFIVKTFVHDDSVSEDGSFHDRYFPHLHEYLAKNGVQVFVHPVLHGFQFHYFSIFRKMRKSSTAFILQEDFLHLSDYLSALSYPARTFLHRMDSSPFQGTDLTDILEEERKTLSVTSGLEAMLIYRLFLRFSESGFAPKVIIDWHENQVIDKALCAAARKSFPHTLIIGAHMYMHSSLELNLMISPSEVEAKITPHVLLATSQRQCEVARSYSRRLPCRPAAALRYSHIFENELLSKNCTGKRNRNVLVLLPFIIDDAVEMIDLLKKALAQVDNDVRMLIKTHPDYSSVELINSFGRTEWPARFKIFEGSLPDALSQVGLVISSNTGSIVEAAAKGIPVVFIGKQTALNYNLLSDLDLDIVSECFTPDDLRAAMNEYMFQRGEARQFEKIADRVRQLFFEPVNEATLLPFLGIEDLGLALRGES